MNTNGMRVPVTARKQLTFNDTTIKAGRVFDALTPAKAKELYTAGDVVYGDASGDHSILIKEPPQPPAPVVSRPVVVPPQRTVAMVKTVNPEAPVQEVSTDKSSEPVAPESAASQQTKSSDTVTSDADTDSSKAVGDSAEAAKTVEEQPVKKPEAPVASPAPAPTKKVVPRKR